MPRSAIARGSFKKVYRRSLESRAAIRTLVSVAALWNHRAGSELGFAGCSAGARRSHAAPRSLYPRVQRLLKMPLGNHLWEQLRNLINRTYIF